MKSSDQRFVGGMRLPIGGFATSPFAQLRITESGVELRLFGLRVGRYSWEEITFAENVRGLGTLGVRIETSRPSEILFWSKKARTIIEAIGKRQISVHWNDRPKIGWL